MGSDFQGRAAMSNELTPIEYAQARQAVVHQASEVVEDCLGFFDPGRMIDELDIDLPKALRKLAASIEAGQMKGHLSSWHVADGGGNFVDARITLGLSAPVRKAIG